MRLVITSLLAHLLVPSDFGLIAMAFVFSQFGSRITDVGMSPGLVQRRVITREHVSTAFVVGGAIGLVFALILVAASEPLARFFHEPRLQAILIVLSAGLVVKALTGTPHSLLRRAMQYRAFFYSYAISVAIGGATGIAVALLHRGVWALVAYSLVEAVVGFLAALYFAVRLGVWSPSIKFSKSAAGDLLGFGTAVSVRRIVAYVQGNFDDVLVGRYLGATALGYYDLAFRVMLYPITRMVDVISDVAAPAFSIMQNDRPRVRRAFLTSIRTICLVCFPVSVGSVIAAPLFVPLLFGRHWSPAVATVQLLAVTGVALAMNALHGDLFQALGRPWWPLVLTVTTTALLFPGFLIAVKFGIEAVALCYVITIYLLLPVRLVLLHYVVGQRVTQLARALGPVVLATLVMAGAAQAIRTLLDAEPLAWNLAATVVGGGLAYVVVLAGFNRHLIGDTLGQLRRGARSSPETGTPRPLAAPTNDTTSI